jgi:uncharacterized protein (TIGR02145 family)
MRTNISTLALTAALMLAITFTLSCSDNPDDDGGGGTSSPSGGGCPNAITSNNTVSCGGQTYKTVVIGSQTWMAENLNYNATGTKCYGNSETNCTTYGRLYDWETAMKACPSGWHLPSREEWRTLTNSVGGDSGTKLKASSGWNNSAGYKTGTDDYGFKALPGGYTSLGSFYDVGEYGKWWSATSVLTGASAGILLLYANNPYGDVSAVLDKTELCSVRCVKN